MDLSSQLREFGLASYNKFITDTSSIAISASKRCTGCVVTAMNNQPTALPYPYEGPEALRDPILQALRRVVDPEVAMTVVDVGLVYGVTVRADRLHVLLTMTSAA